VAGALALAYAPWVPSLVAQAAHTGAPWAEAPSVLRLLAAPAALFGIVGVVLLALPVVAYVRRRAPGREPVMVLFAVAAATLAAAWLASQAQPAWATRYVAVVFGPLLLAIAGALAYADRRTLVAMAAVAGAWVGWAPPAEKSNIRSVAAIVGPALGPGDVVLSVGPEHVPALATYLPAGLRYATPAGRVADRRVTDWRDLVDRMERRPAHATLAQAVAGLQPGNHLVLVVPVPADPASTAPLRRVERRRARELRALLAADRRFERELTTVGALASTPYSAVRAEVFVRGGPQAAWRAPVRSPASSSRR
jgi:hypothetical protein